MSAFIIVIILSSGFMFTSRYPKARFKQIRSEGWALYLHSFSWGLLFSFISLIPTILISLTPLSLWLAKFSIFYAFGSVSFNLLCWALFSECIAFVLGFRLNDTKHATQAVKDSSKENDFKNAIYDAMTNGDVIQVTLESRKVYIGFVFSLNTEDMLHGAEYISLWVVMSGYRRSDELSLVLTNNYIKQYDKILGTHDQDYSSIGIASMIMQKSLSDNRSIILARTKLQKFTIVIPTSKIVSVGYFDPDAYETINCNNQ